MSAAEQALATAPYKHTGRALLPQAQVSQHADGAWWLHAPAGEFADPPDSGSIVWPGLAPRAEDASPMLRQRAADGAWRELSWVQAWQRSRRLACALLRLGFGVDRPIATLSGNSLEQAVLRLAAMMAGVPLVHLSPAYSLLSRDHAPLKAALALAPCAAVFVQDAKLYARALDSVATACGITQVIAADSAAPGHLRLADLEQQALDEDALASARAALRADQACGVYFTSGSTGAPKAVPISHAMLQAHRRMSLSRTAPPDRKPVVVLDWLPWHHVFAGVANLGRLLAVGGTYHIDEGRPVPGQFDATLRNLRDVAPTSYVSSPLAFSWLSAALEADEGLACHFFSRLETLAYGGASLPRETWLRMQTLAVKYTGHKLPFLCGLGATETTAAGLGLYWASDDPSSVGLPHPEVTLKLVPLEGQSDRSGRFELRLKGPHVFTGYLGRPELNATAFDEQGFYRLGDAVRFMDPGDPLRGLRFDGRVAEDFKLASGTWVRAGALRLQAVTLLSPLITDAVVCGADRADIGILAWPNEAALRALDAALAAVQLADLLRHPVVLSTLQSKLDSAAGQGGAGTVQRVALLATPPQLDAGETTDKGYVNQGAALRHRAAEVERLYRGDAAEGVVCRSR